MGKLRILVFGASSYIGRSLCDYLEKNNFEIIQSSTADCDFLNAESVKKFFVFNFRIPNQIKLPGLLACTLWSRGCCFDNVFQKSLLWTSYYPFRFIGRYLVELSKSSIKKSPLILKSWLPGLYNSSQSSCSPKPSAMLFLLMAISSLIMTDWAWTDKETTRTRRVQLTDLYTFWVKHMVLKIYKK